MSLQWTAVATFLYAEVFAVLLLCIPFISPKRVLDPRRAFFLFRPQPFCFLHRWQKIFKSRLVHLVVTYGNTFFVVLVVILVLLLIDALREIRKYDDVTEKVNLQNNPGAVEHFHMKLFRAQRNLYIAGFSLLLSFLLRRLVTLISQQATLLASNEAFKKQAESASEAAKKYMEENDQLKKEAAGGVKLDGRDAEVKVEEENRSLKADLQRLKDELAVNKQKLEKAENEALAMRKQSEGLTKEYDRLLEEHAKLQAEVDGPTDKKEE
ncbi:B-cell receptor-associated protein 31 isoform X1 [Monodon monoceros]|uniref:B-cell receptor-associated protein 31 isoform X1 n=1 Tax=Monodon monoceros TaxID=40151 RepID=UPI0010F812D0|nr:B-cell receptor-associated protein 31 isoform X1 [Monodon monoceros]XP_029096433.1 B-cell receptor-associated protein 31 isoform X1 [Monodon monoceros]